MSKLKTVVVFHRFVDASGDWVYVTDSVEFGNKKYPTAHCFIDDVKSTYRKAGYKSEITNVVIG